MSYGPPQPPPRPAPPAHPTSYRGALRVAGAIAAVKWLLIVLLVLAFVAAAVYVADTSGGSDLGGYPLVLALVVGTVALLLVVLLVWVVLGWFEHTLRVLVAVADHTRDL